MARQKADGQSSSLPRKASTSSLVTESTHERLRSGSASPDFDVPTGPLSLVIAPEDRDIIEVNNSNLIELKNACDDAVKKFLARPTLFTQSHTHMDVRLGLGWAGVFTAAGTAFYGYKVPFEEAKLGVWAGLILYIILTSLQALYAFFVEGQIVFVGRRKTFAKRIVTERITLSSRTTPVNKVKPPGYELSLTYVRSTSGGKSLLARGKTNGSRSYGAFFDESGTMDQPRFEQWVGELVEGAMEGGKSS